MSLNTCTIITSFMEENKHVDHSTDAPKKSKWQKFRAQLFTRPPKKRLLIITGVSLGFLALGTGLIYSLQPEPEPVAILEIKPAPEVEKLPEPTIIASPLTGVLVEPELATRRVTGVMIENSIDARPQSGLSEAGVVFEAIAEGGITRFLALFQESKPANFGPIRSARPYYVQWAAGFDASYIHSGGSGEALQLIRTLGMNDLDHGAYGEKIASRISTRYAPHNVYTSMDRADALANELGYSKSEFTPFARKDDPKTDEFIVPTASTINFDISGANYNTYYSYEKETNSYKRFLARQPHSDADSGKQISPKVIVALVTDYGIHPDRIHSVYRTLGTGKIIVFQDGIAVEGTWQKDNDTSSLIFKDLNGKPLELNRGLTWITAITSGRTTYTP